MAIFKPKKQLEEELSPEEMQDFDEQVEITGGFDEEQESTEETPQQAQSQRGRPVKQQQQKKPQVKPQQNKSVEQSAGAIVQPEVRYVDRPVVVSEAEMFNLISERLGRQESELLAHREALARILELLEGGK